ncbi:MAG: outer membrane beta-barrel domain-containing protein [Myxococcota bacterium]|nr:outer membrane beta-barrel domain-containing protein [Myxococcota bacterium]
MFRLFRKIAGLPLIFLAFQGTAVAAEPVIYVGGTLGVNDSQGQSISESISKTIRSTYGVGVRLLNTGCQSAPCQISEMQGTAAEILIITDVANMMGFYVADIRVYDLLDSGGEIANVEAEGESLSELKKNISNAILELAKERFLGIQQREVSYKAPKMEENNKEDTKRVVANVSKELLPGELTLYNKGGQLEISAAAGLQLNNPMVDRRVVSVSGVYYLQDRLGLEAHAAYSPDLGLTDVKGLTKTLVLIAHSGSADLEFQQPLDKMELGLTFGARWTPIRATSYPIGQNVIKTDIYGTAGLGFLSTNLYYAQYDPTNMVTLVNAGRKIRIPVQAGWGIKFFLNKSFSFNIDHRHYFYQGLKPQYDPEVPVNESQIYHNHIASLGVSFFPAGLKSTNNLFAKSIRSDSKRMQSLSGHQVEAGVSTITNDPFLYRRGISTAYTFYPREMFAFKAVAEFYPDFGDADWKPLTKQLVEQNSVSPDISKMQALAYGTIGIEPLYYHANGHRGFLGFNAGLGMVQTVDDLSALQAEEDVRAISSQIQNHLLNVFGIYTGVSTKRIGLAIHLDSMMYIETVNATTLEMKNNLALKARVTLPIGN